MIRHGGRRWILRRAWRLRRRMRASRPMRHPAGWLIAAAFVTSVIIINGCLTRETHTPLRTEPPAPPLTGAAPLDPLVRVRLCGRNGTPSFTLAVESPCRIEDPRDGRLLEDVHGGLPSCAVAPAADAPRGIRMADLLFDSDRLRIAPDRDGALRVNGKRYRGVLLVWRAGSQLLVNNELDIESYLPSVLAGELPSSFHAEAFAALAVAARTYVLYQKQQFGRQRDFDVLPDERSQMYVSADEVTAAALAAAERTRGEVCMLSDADGGGLFCTFYSSCCGGRTQGIGDMRRDEPRVAPLAGGVACDGCRDSPPYRWAELRLSKAELTRRLVARYPTMDRIGPITRFEPAAYSPDGRITRIRLAGGNGDSETLYGEDFRLAVGGRAMRSTRCRLYDDGDGIVFYDGIGFGHGVGLCQYGANSLARRGYDYRGIIEFYYPGSVIHRAL